MSWWIRWERGYCECAVGVVTLGFWKNQSRFVTVRSFNVLCGWDGHGVKFDQIGLLVDLGLDLIDLGGSRFM